MPPIVALAITIAGIAGLFWLDRQPRSKVSPAIALPIIWISISGSRFVSQWLNGIGVGGGTIGLYQEGSPLDAMIFAVMLAIGLVVLAARRRSLSILRANWVLLLFFLYCMLSVAWSDFPMVTFKRWIKAVGDLVMVLIVLTDREPTTALRKFLSQPGFILIPLSICLIRYFPELGRGYATWTGEAFNTGAATGKNGLGVIGLIFGLGIVWCLVDQFKNRTSNSLTRRQVALITILLMDLWVFRLAHSATSFGCFLLGSAFIVMTSAPKVSRHGVMLSITVWGLLFVIVYGLLINPELGLAQIAGRDSTLTGRTRLWQQILPFATNSLIGAGYESFWLGERLEAIWRINWEHPNQAHNGYLEIFLDLGYIGLAMLGLVMLAGYRNVVQALRCGASVGELRIALFIVAAIYNLTEHAFRELHPVWIAFLLAVTVVPQSSLYREKHEAFQ